MSAHPIDLDTLRARRDAEVRHGRNVVAARADSIADRILFWAGRADRAHSRLVGDDAEAVYAVSRWCLRRLQGDVRRLVGKNLPNSVKADTLGLSEAAFLDCLRTLEASRGCNGGSQ